MFFPVSEWLPAFVLTLVVELPIVLAGLRPVEPNLGRLAVLVVFANLATHQAVWFVFTQLFLVGTPAYVVAAETWAVGAEAVFYAVAVRGTSPGRALGVAFAANAASFLVGRFAGESIYTLLP